MITRKQVEELSILDLLELDVDEPDADFEDLETANIFAGRIAEWLATRGFLNQFIDEKGEVGWQLHPDFKGISDKKMKKITSKWMEEERKKQ